MSDVSARLVLACLLSLVAGSWGISAEVNASMASACWHEEGDAGIGLLSLRVRKAGGIKKQLPEQKIQEAFENCDALTTSYPKQFLLDTLIGVLVMAALHCLLHPLFQDVSARPADAKPRLDLLDNAKFWMLTIICANHTPCGPSFNLIKFHTRGFAFVSGWVTRNRKPDRRGVRSFLVTQVASLLFFVAFLGPLAKFLNPETADGFPTSLAAYFGLIYNDFKYPFRDTGTHIWYAQALIFWQLCGFLLSGLQRETKILISCLGFVVAWLAPPIPFVVSTALVFLPFFFIGQAFPVETCLKAIPELGPWSVSAGMAMMTAIFAVEGLPILQGVQDVIDRGPDSIKAEDLPKYATKIETLGKAAFFSAMALIKVLVFLLFLCPRTRTWYTDLGKHSLYTYHLHQPVLNALFFSSLTTSLANLAMSWSSWGAAWFPYWAWGIFLNAVLASKLVQWSPLSLILEPTWLNQLLDQGAAPEAEKS